MDRRESIKTMVLGGLSLPFLKNLTSEKSENKDISYLNVDLLKISETSMLSPWHLMPDMNWTGAGYWANRLQDWQIKNGSIECDTRGHDRTVYSLTHQMSGSRERFISHMHIQIPAEVPRSDENRVGFRLGSKGNFSDYRCAAVFGKGFDTGITTNGKLFIGKKQVSKNKISGKRLQDGIILKVSGEPRGMHYVVRVEALHPETEKKLAAMEQINIDSDKVTGNIGIISDYRKVPDSKKNGLACRIAYWQLEGKKFTYHPDQTYGPVYFAQYTQHNGILKLTAQLAPVPLPGKAYLEINKGTGWKQIGEANLDYPSYTARFKFTNWDYSRKTSYRIRYELPERGEESTRSYFWEGTIAKEPENHQDVKALLMCCNGDMGFPDQEVVDNALEHDADLIMFVGDQYYEGNGGFGTQRSPEEKAYLGFLRKWYEFGWSYRELFRHRPSITIPDDHDIWQGNYWGMDGKKAASKGAILKNEQPGGYDAGLNSRLKKSIQSLRQDTGGYTMPAQWVNLVYLTQTSHMPDPFDPVPMKQGIHTFYTDWKYAGISMAIVEDREFKSAPKDFFPKKTNVWNGYIQNKHFLYWADKHTYPDAKLLGDRQLKFLEHWVEDWGDHTQFKVWVSATPFHCLQTLPKGSKNDQVTPGLKVPKPGEYIKGDVQTRDMDTDGWPQNKRDKALKLLRKGFALHLTGDQHLASVTQYGVDDYQDAGYQFTAPALGNIWPRRWWPPIPKGHKPLPGRPINTGNFKDGFDNKMHVVAFANPVQTGLKPSRLYDRATGYGVITFHKKNREITMECWSRYMDPKTNPVGQYDGWPITINQRDNYNPPKGYLLPTLTLKGVKEPMIRVIHESSGELDHALRINGNEYQPKVLREGKYTVEIITNKGQKKTIKDLIANKTNDLQKKVNI